MGVAQLVQIGQRVEEIADGKFDDVGRPASPKRLLFARRRFRIMGDMALPRR